MNFRVLSPFLFAFGACAGSASLLAAQDQPPTIPQDAQIKAVVFEGLVGVSEAFCRSKMVTAAGRPFSQAVLDEDIRRLNRTGKFLDVRSTTVPEQHLVTVIIQVREFPVIASIDFAGNLKFSDKALLKDLEFARQELHHDVETQTNLACLEDLLAHREVADQVGSAKVRKGAIVVDVQSRGDELHQLPCSACLEGQEFVQGEHACALREGEL